MFILGSSKGHDPHEMEVSHVRYMGLNHSNIHVVYFHEDMFKGVFFYEEVLQKLLDDASRKELQVEQEEMRKFHQNQFLRLLQEDQDKIITKEKENIKKAKELEYKRMKVDVEYQRRQAEEKYKR
jgi:hypothetical protein